MNDVAGKKRRINEPAAADAELELNSTMFFGLFHYCVEKPPACSVCRFMNSHSGKSWRKNIEGPYLTHCALCIYVKSELTVIVRCSALLLMQCKVVYFYKNNWMKNNGMTYFLKIKLSGLWFLFFIPVHQDNKQPDAACWVCSVHCAPLAVCTYIHMLQMQCECIQPKCLNFQGPAVSCFLFPANLHHQTGRKPVTDSYRWCERTGIWLSSRVRLKDGRQERK